MMKPGEYSDTLRALGRYFESVWSAKEVALADQRSHLEIAWISGGRREERRLSPEDLEELRAAARQFRGTGSGQPTSGTAEALRTIGREIDGMRAERVSITETDTGFQVVGQVKGGKVKRDYTHEELAKESQTFHLARLDREPEA